LRSEEDQGRASSLIEATDLLQRPSNTSRSLGALPKGTILTLTGETRGNYAAVDVELEDGEVSGWVLLSALAAEDDGEEEDASAATRPPPKKTLKLRKGKIPKDESLLLRREPTFYYGGSVGMGYHIIQSQFDTEVYIGMGPHFDGYFGYFVDNDLSVKFLLGMSSPSGTSSQGVALSMNVLDIGVFGEMFFLKKMRAFAGLQYSMGIGLGELPATYRLNSSSDISSLWGVFGGGYTFPLSDVTRLVVRGYYGISFASSPVALQTIGLAASLEFQG
jgi:hypothetical protein